MQFLLGGTVSVVPTSQEEATYCPICEERWRKRLVSHTILEVNTFYT